MISSTGRKSRQRQNSKKGTRAGNRLRFGIAAVLTGLVGGYFVFFTHANPASGTGWSPVANSSPLVGHQITLAFTLYTVPPSPAVQSVEVTFASDSSYLQYQSFACLPNVICSAGRIFSPDPTLHTDLAECVTLQPSDLGKNSVDALTTTYTILKAGNARLNYLALWYKASCGNGNDSNLIAARGGAATLTTANCNNAQVESVCSGGAGNGSGNGGGNGSGGGGGGTTSHPTSSPHQSASKTATAVSPVAQSNPISTTSGQGTQTPLTEQQPSPFFDGKNYAVGSDASPLSATLSDKKSASWRNAGFILLGSCVVIIGYTFWHERQRLLFKRRR